jgi:hypothetical protein
VFSANDYTKGTKDLDRLIDEINYFQEAADALEFHNTLVSCLSELGQAATEINDVVEEKAFEPYPYNLPQFTPKEIEAELNEAGFVVKNFHFYHAHIFPPAFGRGCPHLYNSIGIKMQPLAKSSIGALICSAFIAEVVKA